MRPTASPFGGGPGRIDSLQTVSSTACKDSSAMTSGEPSAPSTRITDKPPGNFETGWFFFRRWLANPLTVAMPIPSSRGVRRVVTEHTICGPDQCVVEFGAGSGSITQAFLDAGVPPGRLYTIEIDGKLVDFMRRSLPHVNLIHGDAREALTLVGPEWHGKAGTVMVGIPLIMLPKEVQRQVLDVVFTLLPPGGRFLQLTYSWGPPLPMDKHGLVGERLGWAWSNAMPLSVWGFRRA